jgi:hypothetical protein
MKYYLAIKKNGSRSLHNKDETWKAYAKWKEPDTSSICMKCLQQVNL